MKENKLGAEEMWLMIITCLKGASEAGMYAFWRERFGTDHPGLNKEEVENPTRYAYANFFAAKGLYCQHKQELDVFHLKQWELAESPGYISPSRNECELFDAMKRVVEEEMAAQLEEQILIAEEPQGYWEGDEYLPLPESNDIEFDLNSY